MIDAIIIVLLGILCALIVIRYVRKLRRGDSCCTEGEEMPKRVRAADHNKANYPYAITLTIDGMTCANCARRVENALNSLPDTWATVDLAERSALVRGKAPFDEERLRQAVRESGYTALRAAPVV